MEENSAQPQVIYTASTPLFKKKLFQAGLLLAISPLFVLAFLWIKELPFFKSQSPAPPPIATSSASIKEENLPIALDILQDPAIYQWTGSVEGTIEAKDNTYLAIATKDNHSITIPIDSNPNGTKFYSNKPGKDLKAQSLTINDMRIGSKVRGDFFIIPDKKNEMRAGSFVIIEP